VVGGLALTTISAGLFHTCGLTADGATYCWGQNIRGAVGDGTRERRLTPTAVLGGLRFRSLNAGGWHTCGITTDGVTYCWGRNHQRTTAQPDIYLLTATAVTGDPGFTTVAVGSHHVCGLATDGSLYCWGSGGRGELGVGTLDFYARVPTPVAVAARFTAVARGTSHTCAVTTAGEAFCWGSNYYGQLGNESNTVGWAIPVPVWVAVGQ
jgi:alpha-tubulin suppressor-like RCC1 family protein